MSTNADAHPATADAAGDPLPTVTIVMPIRNEAAHIRASLSSALAFDYPPERVEILAIDGMSDDGTREAIAALAAAHPRVRVIDNPQRRQAYALNRGIAEAKGDVVVRLDAHAYYPRDYLRRCVALLLETGAENVGGTCVTIPGADTAMAKAIALALSHRFGVGTVAFRTGVPERRSVDTVPFGCWRRDVLVRLGGFATDLPYAEDDELNARTRRLGGRIVLDPGIQSRYVARATLSRLASMLFHYGHDKPLAAQRIGRVTTLRQLAPPAFVLALGTAAVAALSSGAGAVALVGLLGAHALAGAAIGLRWSAAHGIATGVRAPLVFLVMHGAYGAGYLCGAAGLLARGLRSRATARSGQRRDVPG